MQFVRYVLNYFAVHCIHSVIVKYCQPACLEHLPEFIDFAFKPACNHSVPSVSDWAFCVKFITQAVESLRYADNRAANTNLLALATVAPLPPNPTTVPTIPMATYPPYTHP